MKPYNVKVTSVSPGAVMSDSWAGSGVDPKRIMEANDVAEMIYAATQLSPMAAVECQRLERIQAHFGRLRSRTSTPTWLPKSAIS